MALTPEEIDHIGTLLLHAKPANVDLAKALLQERYAHILPQMQERALLYTLFHPEDVLFRNWVIETIIKPTPIPLEAYLNTHPIFPLAQALHSPSIAPLPSLTTLQEFLLVWKEQAPDIESHPKRCQAYAHLYPALSVVGKGHDQATEQRWAPLLIYILRKALQHYTDANRASRYQWLRDLSYLLHHYWLGELTPAYIEEVRKLYQQVYDVYPAGPPLYQCGLFYEEVAKDYTEAERYYQRGWKEFPEHTAFAEALARFAQQRGDYEACKTWLQKALKHTKHFQNDGKGRSRLYTQLAAAEWAGFQYLHAARTLYRKAVELSPAYLPAVEGLAELLWTTGQEWAPATALFGRALKHSTAPVEVWKAWGAFCERHYQFKEAERVYEKAAKATGEAHFYTQLYALRHR